MEQPSERKADRVARDLLRRIVGGELAVGSQLPREEELAAAYGVNRGVVREAVKLLEVHRLVRPVRRKGTEVLSPFASLSPEVLRAMLVPGAGRVDRRVLAGFLEVRALLDAEMTAVAALRRRDEDLARLEAWLQAVKALLREHPDPRRYARAIDELPRLLAEATGNPIYRMLVAWNQAVTSDLEHIFLATRPASEPHVAALGLLLERLRARDAAGARTLVLAFHEWATPRLLAAAALAEDDSFQRHVMEKNRWPSPAPPAPSTKPRSRPRGATSARPGTAGSAGSTSSSSRAPTTRWGGSTGRSSPR